MKNFYYNIVIVHKILGNQNKDAITIYIYRRKESIIYKFNKSIYCARWNYVRK